VKLCGLDSKFPTETAFPCKPIYIKVEPTPAEYFQVNQERMYVNYLSDPTDPRYRYCDREGVRHTEFIEQQDKVRIVVRPGKIKDSPLAKTLLDVLQSHGVVCFGRFARWEPNELVHETFRRLREWGQSL